MTGRRPAPADTPGDRMRSRWAPSQVRAGRSCVKLPPLQYVRASSVSEAVGLLVQGAGDARILAGGQSLIPVLAFRLAAPAVLVDIGGIAELKRIDITDETVTLGALVRWVDIERSAALKAHMPLLPAVMAHVAHYQIRNRGTVGGSLAHCDPAAEMPGLAVTCDGTIILEGASGRREVPAAEVLTSALAAEIAEDEMIVALRFPRWQPGRCWGFAEFARRKGDFAMAGIITHFDRDADGATRDVHLGVIGATDRPTRLPGAEAALEGRIPDTTAIRDTCRAVQDEVEPPEDIHASAAYRRALAGVMAEQALHQAARQPATVGGQ